MPTIEIWCIASLLSGHPASLSREKEFTSLWSIIRQLQSALLDGDVLSQSYHSLKDHIIVLIFYMKVLQIFKDRPFFKLYYIFSLIFYKLPVFLLECRAQNRHNYFFNSNYIKPLLFRTAMWVFFFFTLNILLLMSKSGFKLRLIKFQRYVFPSTILFHYNLYSRHKKLWFSPNTPFSSHHSNSPQHHFSL